MPEMAELIYERMSAVMSEVGAIRKDQTNPFDKYKFRGIDDVYNALHPAMVKHGVVALPVLHSCERSTLTTTKGAHMQLAVVDVSYVFYAEDGSSVTARAPGEGSDRGDKAVNKAMSSAYKTAMFQAFCIPTEEQKDSEHDSPDLGGARPHSQQAPPAPPAPGPFPSEAAPPAPAAPGEYYFGAKDGRPEEPSWAGWKDDAIKSGKMKGRTWREICEGTFKGQRYQYAVSLATFEPDNPEKFEQTRLRALNAVWEIERGHRIATGEEPF